MAERLFAGSGLTLVVFGLLLVIIFHKPLGALLGGLCRGVLSLAALTLWARSGVMAGLCLGASLFNALVLGFLGVPGLGLLYLLRWVTG